MRALTRNDRPWGASRRHRDLSVRGRRTPAARGCGRSRAQDLMDMEAHWSPATA